MGDTTPTPRTGYVSKVEGRNAGREKAKKLHDTDTTVACVHTVCMFLALAPPPTPLPSSISPQHDRTEKKRPRPRSRRCLAARKRQAVPRTATPTLSTRPPPSAAPPQPKSPARPRPAGWLGPGQARHAPSAGLTRRSVRRESRFSEASFRSIAMCMCTFLT